MTTEAVVNTYRPNVGVGGCGCCYSSPSVLGVKRMYSPHVRPM